MATYKKYTVKSGASRYSATVFKRGKRISKSFSTKRDAAHWAAQMEQQKNLGASDITFRQLLEKYKQLVSPRKKHVERDRRRIDHLLRRYPWLFDKRMADVSRKDVADWRDEHLKHLSPSSVAKDWTILSHCVKVAIIEWEQADSNPFTEVKKPSDAEPRKRIIQPEEVEKLLYVANYSLGEPPKTVRQRVVCALLFALETAMRAQEICNLRWDDIHSNYLIVRESKTKNGIRDVPLSAKARKMLDVMAGLASDNVFNITTSQLDSNFRKLRTMAALDGFTFHDSRATAITRMASKLDPYDLARAVGHKDLSMVMVYYRKTAAQLADKLD